MRGFKDHCKLTMVGFRFNRCHCLFGGYGVCFGGQERIVKVGLGSRLVSRLVFGGGVTVLAVQCRGKTRIQTSLGLDLETGRCQNPRGECFHKGTKEPGAEEQWGTQSLWDFWDEGCPGSTKKGQGQLRNEKR